MSGAECTGNIDKVGKTWCWEGERQSDARLEVLGYHVNVFGKFVVLEGYM